MQLDLEFPTTLTGIPVPGRQEPVFWICELRLLKKFSAEPGAEIRRVKFRRGLNVVWAEPPKVADDRADQRISGHASGKSTLCRLIRYVFGEETLAEESVAERIRAHFPDGWVVAHVRVKEKSWTVARSFIRMREDCSAATGSIDQFLAGRVEKSGYHQFRKVMEDLLPDITPMTKLHSGELLTFWHLFPWLTRDQDCQFQKVQVWRDNPASQANAPVLTQEQAMLVMRSVIEPESVREAELVERLNDLAQKRKDLSRRDDFLSKLIDQDQARIQYVGQMDSNGTGLGELLHNEIRDRCQRLIDGAESLAETEASRLEEYSRARDDLFAQCQGAEDQYTDALAGYRQRLRELKTLQEDLRIETFNVENLDEIQEAARRRPTRSYCHVPLEVARAEGCHLDEKHTEPFDRDSLENLARIKNDENKLHQQRNALEIYRSFLQQEKLRIDGLKRDLASAEKILEEFRAQIEYIKTKRISRASRVLEALDRLEHDRQQAEATKQDIREVDADHKAYAEDLKKTRDRVMNASPAPGQFYSEIVGRILGREVSGVLQTRNGKIELSCTYHEGAVSSAAIRAVEHVCFDLSAVALSVEGIGLHPRFLLHDGPRVSDLAANIYGYYFRFVASLEEAAQEEPNFQYIITTTEPPPAKFLEEPWLVCHLDASKAETRLLKTDLA